MRERILVGSILALSLAGCSLGPATANPPSSSDARPTVPLPSPLIPPIATDYIPGEVRIPEGSFLFLEETVHDEASGQCQYPPSAQQPPLGYSFESGILTIDRRSLDVGPISSYDEGEIIQRAVSSIGFFGHRTTESYSLGGATHAWMSVMAEAPASIRFPYGHTDAPLVLEALDEHGEAVLTIQGTAYSLQPEAAWQVTEQYEPQPGCLVTRTATITNHGLLLQDQVQFTDEPIT